MSSKKKVLYVDDESINLMVFKISFPDYEIETALNAQKALDILEEKPEISVVISDMKMPKMNGLEFIKVARNQRPDISYMMMTGFGLTEEIDQAMKEGIIKTCLQKPMNKHKVVAAIEDETKH